MSDLELRMINNHPSLFKEDEWMEKNFDANSFLTS